QLVPEYILGDVAPHLGARILVEAKVYPAVDARVIDIRGDLLELRVLQGHPGDGRDRHCDGIGPHAVYTLDDVASCVGQGGVSRRIARETRRDDKRCKSRIEVGLWVVVRITRPDRRLRAPEVVVVFGIERRDRGVADGHVEERQGASVLRERIVLRGVSYYWIEHSR